MCCHISFCCVLQVSLRAKSAVHNVKLTCNVVQPLVAVDTTTVIPSVGKCNSLLYTIVLLVACNNNKLFQYWWRKATSLLPPAELG